MLLLIIVSFFNITTASEIKHKLLTVNDAIMLALRFHPDVKNAELDRIVDKFSLEVAANKFMPQYLLGGVWSAANNQVNSGIINTEISLKSTLGGQVAISKNWGGDNASPTISFAQPLLRGFGTQVNLTELESAQDAEYIGRLRLKATLMQIISGALKSYWDLMATQKNLQVQQQALDIMYKTLESYEIKVKIGQMPRYSLDQQKTALLKGKLQFETQRNKVDIAQQNLLMALGLNPDSKIEIDSDFSAMHKIKLPTLKQSLALALKYNIKYLQKKLMLRNLYRTLLVAQDAQNWQLDAVGSVQSSNWHAGLSLSIPVDDLARQNQLLRAKVNYDKGVRDLLRAKQLLISDIKNRWYNCKSQLEQIDISIKSVKSAQNDYKIAVLKQMSGMNSSFEVISLQQQWVDANVALINLKISYLYSLITLHLELGSVLQLWGIQLTNFGEVENV